MHSATLEQDLISYSIKQDDIGFNLIHPPLKLLIKWLISKKYSNISQADYKDMEQLCLLRIIKDIKYFKLGKGMKAISFARMLIGQEINKQRVKMELNKNADEYNTEKDPQHYQLEFNSAIEFNSVIEKYKFKLKEYCQLAPLTHREIITVIINTMDNSKVVHMTYIERIKYYSDESKTTRQLVKECIRSIRQQGIRLAL